MVCINNAAGPMILYYSFVTIPYYCLAMSIIIQEESLPTKLQHAHQLVAVLTILCLAAYTSGKVYGNGKGFR